MLPRNDCTAVTDAVDWRGRPPYQDDFVPEESSLLHEVE